MKLILALLALLVGGCATQTMEEMYAQYNSLCKGKNTPECVEMEDELIAREDRNRAQRQKREQEEALIAYCQAGGAVMFCETRAIEKECYCVDKETLSGILNGVFR